MSLFFWTKADYDAVMSMLFRILSMQQQNQTLINKLLNQEVKVMSALDDLTAQVHANTDLEQSAVSLIQGIAAQLQEAINNNDSSALSALASQLNTSAAALGAAVTANTHADPAPPADPNAPQVNPLSARRR